MTDETLAADAAEAVEAVESSPLKDVQDAPEGVESEAPEAEKPEAPAAPKEDGDEDTGSKRKNRRSAEERIGQLTRRLREREAEVERLRKAVSAPPKEEDFPDYDAFQEARAKHAARQALAEDYAETAKAARQEVDEAMKADWRERVAEFKARAPDFEAVVYSDKVPISADMADAIMHMGDDGPAVAYHLAKNPLDAERIASLPPVAAAAALGRLAERMKSPARRMASSAPPPISPVVGNGGIAEKDPSKMSMAEYRAWRRGS